MHVYSIEIYRHLHQINDIRLFFANDVRFLAVSVDRNMTLVANHMEHVASDMDRMSSNVELLSASVGTISSNVETLEPMLANMSSMDDAIRTMALSTGQMRSDMVLLNQSVGRPMSFLGSFMPW